MKGIRHASTVHGQQCLLIFLENFTTQTHPLAVKVSRKYKITKEIAIFKTLIVI